MSNIYIKLITTVNSNITESKEFELWYDKYAESKDIKNHEEAFKMYQAEAGKNPVFGKIYSITIAGVFHNGEEEVIGVKVIKGCEKNILQFFYNLYIEKEGFFNGASSVFWNGDFVLPFLSFRATKNRVQQTSTDLRNWGIKPWNLKCFDLMSYLNSSSWFKPSFEEVCHIFNQEVDLINPLDIQRLIETEQENLIDDSTTQEIKALVNIHRILENKSEIQNVVQNIIYLSEEAVVKEEELPILEQLYSTKILNKEKLIKHLKERGLKKTTKKAEKETVKNIVLAHYLEKIEVTSLNKKELEEINKKRTEEIEELFKSL